MRSALISTVTFILIACGAFLFVSGGLDYWESKFGQREIASEWNNSETAASAASEAEQAGTPSVPDSEARQTSEDQETHALESRPEKVIPRRGSAMARLSIPRLHTALYVIEGDSSRDLKRGPGHLVGTALPGEPGNCIIAAHRDTHFRVLKGIRKGDEIVLQRGGETFRYRVDEISIVSPKNTASLQRTHNAVLNLITCYPFYYVGAAPKRFIVHAELEDEPLRASR